MHGRGFDEDVITVSATRRVGYLARGPDNGQPVVYLHGAPGSRREQHLVREAVLERFGVRLISVDRPGYGATDPLPGDRVIRVQDVLAVCDFLGIEQAPVIAVSSGGSYALALAAVAPDRVTRLVLSSAQMPYDDDDAIQFLQPAQRAELPGLRAGRSRELEEECEQFRVALLADAIAVLEDAMSTFSTRERAWCSQSWIRDALAADMQEGMRPGIEGYLEDGLSCVRPFEFDLSAVRCPVRAVHGSEDDWEPLANLQRVLAQIADVQLFVLDGLNHLGPLLYSDLLISLCVGDW